MLSITSKALAVLSLPILSAGMADELCWTQLGPDINGESEGDNFGSSVSLSKDGSTVAIGAFLNDGYASNGGHVRVYRWDISTSTWLNYGEDIQGESEGEQFGSSVSIDQYGNKIAIGALGNSQNGSNAGRVSVYNYDSGQWVKDGQDLFGDAAYTFLGIKDSISLSGDGYSLALGLPGNDDNGDGAGKVNVYDVSTVSFDVIGTINGEVGDQTGTSVSLSKDGNIVAIGEIGDNASGYYSGKVRVFAKDNGGNWVQQGDDIYGECEDDGSGESVSLSDDGTVLVIAAVGAQEKTGQVRVFEWIGTEWVQRGNNIIGQAENDYLGRSVSLSGSGNTVAVGADGNDNSAGRVRVFDWHGVTWSERESIDGGAANDQSGYSVSLSDDGTIVAIGSRKNNDNGSESGQVRVFEYSLCESSSKSSKSSKEEFNRAQKTNKAPKASYQPKRLKSKRYK